MSLSLTELADCYVVLWSPKQRIYLTEKFSAMMKRNHTFFLRAQKANVADWLIVGFARTAEAASKIEMQAGQKQRTHNRGPTDDELESMIVADDAAEAALKAGKPLPPRPLPWWFSAE